MKLTKPQRELLERLALAPTFGLYVSGSDLNVAFNLSTLHLARVLRVGASRGGEFAITPAGRAALAVPRLRPSQHRTRHPWRDIRFGREAKP